MTSITGVITHVHEAGFTIDQAGTQSGNPERTQFHVSTPAGEEARFRSWVLVVSPSLVPIDHGTLHFAELGCSPWNLVEGEAITISYERYFEAWLDQRCRFARNRVARHCRQAAEQLEYIASVRA